MQPICVCSIAPGNPVGVRQHIECFAGPRSSTGSGENFERHAVQSKRSHVAGAAAAFPLGEKCRFDELIPTSDVVASPPAARLKPGSEYTVRIVRVAKTPVEGEESYRLLVDQIPAPSEMNGTNVRFVVRHSIPVFFSEPQVVPPRLSWEAHLADGRLIITARNDGERRVRLSGLTVRSSSGTTRSFGKGLSGYVLGKSTARWTANSGSKGFRPGSAITIFARDENGPLESSALVQAQ